jgi:hypothetical protein
MDSAKELIRQFVPKDRLGGYQPQDVAAVPGIPSQPYMYFVVGVTVDGGNAGDDIADCDYTYTLTSPDSSATPLRDAAGAPITGLTPLKPRFSKTSYWQPGANTGGPTMPVTGRAYRDQSGELILEEVLGEQPQQLAS